MTFESSIFIQQPPQAVFRFVALEPKQMKLWVKGFERYKAKGSSKRQPGSRGVQIFNDGGQRTEVQEEVLDLTPYELFRCVLTHRNMVSRQTYRFLDQGASQTKLQVETQVKLRPALFNVFAFFVKRPMRKQQEEDLQRLKRVLEK